MPAPRRLTDEDSATRTALLDAAQDVMVELGYAAVSSRRVAAQAKQKHALVYYYFGTMDDLFIALFRRIAERSLDRQAEILASPQPLWALWDAVQDQFDTRLLMEFNAVAFQRKAVLSEIVTYSRKFRQMQIDVLSSVLPTYGLDLQDWPPASVILLLSGVSRFMLIEESFGIDMGHADTRAVVERHIAALEGERREPLAARKRRPARRRPA